MKSKISLLIFILILILFNKAKACSCADKPTIQDNWKYANQVFIGEVVGIDTSGHLFSATGRQVTTFTIKIIETFKLEIYKNYHYRTFICLGDGSCDSYFYNGKKYLIYANGNNLNGFLKSSICSRTDMLDRIKNDEIEELRKLYKDFKAENEIIPLVADNYIENYELALSKSSNEKLSKEKRIWMILSGSLVVVITLVLTLYVIRRRKTDT